MEQNSHNPPGFGPFQAVKRTKSVEPQQMDKPTAAHNPEVGGSSPPPATRNPLESPDSSGLFLLSATFSRGLFWVLKSDPDFDPYGEKVRSRRGLSAPGPHCFSEVIFAVQRAIVSTRSMALAASFRGAVVPQHPGHCFHVYPILECQGGERVPQIMEPDPWQPRPFQYSVEHMEHAVRRDRPTGG